MFDSVITNSERGFDVVDSAIGVGVIVESGSGLLEEEPEIMAISREGLVFEIEKALVSDARKLRSMCASFLARLTFARTGIAIHQHSG